MKASDHPDFNASGVGAVARIWDAFNAVAPEEDRAIVGLYCNFLMNTDAWRPSDAARAAIRKYEAMGPEKFRKFTASGRH